MAANIYDWSTTAASNANADTGIDWSEGMAPSAVNDSARVMMARVAALLDDLGGVNTVGGTANGITVTLASNFSSYASGMVLAFKAGATNTGATTLNVNGIGAKSVRKYDVAGEGALAGGEIVASGIYLVRYDTAVDSASGGWVLLNPHLLGNSIRVEGSVSALGGVNALFDGTQASALAYGATDTTNAPFLRLRQSATESRLEAGRNGTGSYAPLTFFAGGADAGRITTSRQWLFNTTSFIDVTTQTGDGASFDGGALAVSRTNAVAARFQRSNDGTNVQFYRGTSVVGSVSVTSTATAYNTSSDYRLKENVADYAGSGAVIDALRPVSYTWRVNGQADVGFLAHEVQAVVPTAVNGEKDGEDMQSYDPSKLVPYLVAELKALRARVAALEA